MGLATTRFVRFRIWTTLIALAGIMALLGNCKPGKQVVRKIGSGLAGFKVVNAVGNYGLEGLWKHMTTAFDKGPRPGYCQQRHTRARRVAGCKCVILAAELQDGLQIVEQCRRGIGH